MHVDDWTKPEKCLACLLQDGSGLNYRPGRPCLPERPSNVGKGLRTVLLAFRLPSAHKLSKAISTALWKGHHKRSRENSQLSAMI